jgi:hypothetical protein
VLVSFYVNLLTNAFARKWFNWLSTINKDFKMRIFKFKVTTMENGKIVNHYTEQPSFRAAERVIKAKYPTAVVLCVNMDG